MLKSKAENLMNETTEIVDFIIKKTIDKDTIQSIDADGFQMIQCCYRLMDLMRDYAIEEAETLDEINKKLDRLLGKKD